MEWFESHYFPDDAARREPQASPLLTASFADLPPALDVTAEFDPLRDEGEAYAAALQKAGVPVTLERYEGMLVRFPQTLSVTDLFGLERSGEVLLVESG